MIRIFILVLVIVIASVATLGQQTKGAKVTMRDREAIEGVIGNWNKGWQTKDAKLAARDYSDHADWTNAFGMTRRGRVEIEKFLGEVFSLSFVMAGESKPVEQRVSLIKPDVALVVTRVERAGQRTPTGEEMGVRHTSHLRVLKKSKLGWQIVSHLISDARDPQAR